MTLRPITVADMHTGGEPVRIVTGGYPEVRGATLLDKRRHARDSLDAWRRLLMLEPRGHRGMYGVIPVEPDAPDVHMAVLFMHNEGYSTMCGHAVIALARYAVEQGLAPRRPPRSPVRIQCPCGVVEAFAGEDGTASFLSVPAFAAHLDRTVHVPGHGEVRLDVGYGGAFYAILPAARLGLALHSPVARLVDAAEAVTRAAAAALPVSHPDAPDLGFYYGTILTDGGTGIDPPSANICVFAGRQVDRSPTGSGVTARLAVMHAKGEIGVRQAARFASVTGSEFTGWVAETARLGPHAAIRAEVGGRAHHTGTATFVLEDGDPFPEGFMLDE